MIKIINKINLSVAIQSIKRIFMCSENIKNILKKVNIDKIGWDETE